MDWVDGLHLPHGAAALDGGCGAGLMALDLAERGLKVSAVDASPAMIEPTWECLAARELSVEARVGEAYALSYADAAFALSIAVGVRPTGARCSGRARARMPRPAPGPSRPAARRA